VFSVWSVMQYALGQEHFLSEHHVISSLQHHI